MSLMIDCKYCNKLVDVAEIAMKKRHKYICRTCGSFLGYRKQTAEEKKNTLKNSHKKYYDKNREAYIKRNAEYRRKKNLTSNYT